MPPVARARVRRPPNALDAAIEAAVAVAMVANEIGDQGRDDPPRQLRAAGGCRPKRGGQDVVGAILDWSRPTADSEYELAFRSLVAVSGPS